jgi:hypothetical protein
MRDPGSLEEFAYELCAVRVDGSHRRMLATLSDRLAVFGLQWWMR